LVIGAVLHAVVFLIFVLTSNSISAAPAGVIGWVFTVGILGGGLAGAIGGWLASRTGREDLQSP
jgi:MFS family permease